MLTCAVAVWLLAGVAAGAAPAESRHMARAKDFIADERWVSAIDELRAAAADQKEPNRAEALFWLAHCENQNGEQVSALEAIARLERDFPSSPWVRVAQSLRIEIAQKLNRDDVLWRIARPPQPPSAPPPPLPPDMGVTPRPGSAPPPPAAVDPGTTWWQQRAREMPPFPATIEPFEWAPMPGMPDIDLRIQALGSLIQTHPDRVIPLLKEIALDPPRPGDGRRAVFVLAQSPRREARLSVIDLAKHAPEPVRIAAVKEIGRFDGPAIGGELLQVYRIGTPRVKREVVASLGDRDDKPALLRIVRSESDPTVRNTAIVTLGRTGAAQEIRTLYRRLPPDGRLACLTAFFNARDEDELIRIAETDPDASIRQHARNHLRVLGTPKAIAYLASHK
jgi:hypothetical protein